MLPATPSHRDHALEADLQARLDHGHRIYAVGDVHGHLGTLRALLHRLKVGDEDRVVLLGDAIDRGPDAAGVLDLVRKDPRLLLLLGNHERMATMSLCSERGLTLWQPWMQRGGSATWGSYVVRAEGELHLARAAFLDDLLWLNDLPTELVLNRFRLVHAGYDPRKPLNEQTEHDVLWIRRRFYKHDEPLDPRRTVVFGHSTTTKLGPRPGEVVRSDVLLRNGRPAWVAMDVGAYNHADPGLAALDLATGTVVRQRTLPSERWFDDSEAGEAPVGRAFGLQVLRERSASHARPRAAVYASVTGLILPPDNACRRWAEGQAAIASKEAVDDGWRFIRARSVERTFRPSLDHRVSTAQGQRRHRVMLGPGTPPARKHPSLPPPERYRVVRAGRIEPLEERYAVQRFPSPEHLMQA